jgi:hypothetical protein
MSLLSLFKVSKRENVDRYYLFKAFGFGVFLHNIHHDENPGVFHNHPWNMISFIFGSYVEEHLDGIKKKRRLFNYLPAKRHHRVELSKPVWTLVFHGRRCNEWEVVNSDGYVISKEPWRGTDNPERTSYADVPTVQKSKP